jgi:hypothetical protein
MIDKLIKVIFFCDGHLITPGYTTLVDYFIFSGSAAQRGLWPPRSRGFVITQRRVTVGRTPLDK